MGLLDTLMGNPDQTQALGLLGAGLMAGNPAAAFQSANGLLASAPDRALHRQLSQAQLQDIMQQVELRKQQAAQMQRRNDMINGWLSGNGASVGQPAIPASPGGPIGSGTAGIHLGGQPAVAPASPLGGVPRDAVMADLAFNEGKNVPEWMFKRGTPDWKDVNGNMVNVNAPGFQGGIQPGMKAANNGQMLAWNVGPDGQIQAYTPKGAPEAYGTYISASEAAKAPYDFIQRYNPVTKQMDWVSKATMAGPQPAPVRSAAPQVSPQPGVVGNYNLSDPALVAAINDIKDPQERANAMAALAQQRGAPATPAGGSPSVAAGAPIRTEGQKSADEAFGKDYAQWSAAGGYTDVKKQLDQLNIAAQALKTDSSLTGPLVGMVPESIRSFTNPKAIDTRNLVEESVQRNLRAVLGAQFTENEGTRLIARAFNPQMPAEVNAQRVDRLIRQIGQAAQTKADAAKYFEQNGTLAGWQGKLPTFSDFNPEGSRESGGKVGQTFETMPTANAGNKGKYLTDTANGQRYQSNGFTWVKVQ